MVYHDFSTTQTNLDGNNEDAEPDHVTAKFLQWGELMFTAEECSLKCHWCRFMASLTCWLFGSQS